MEKSKKRMNWNNFFIMMYKENREIVKEFCELPYDKRICFAPNKMDVEAALYIDIKNNEELRNLEFWEVVNHIAGGIYKFYTSLELLSGNANN